LQIANHGPYIGLDLAHLSTKELKTLHILIQYYVYLVVL